MKLYEGFPGEIELNGVTYRLCLPFDRVLRYIDLLKADDYTIEEAAEIGYEYLSAKRLYPYCMIL